MTRLVVDPGHGGESDGIVVDSAREDALVLDIAKELVLSLHGLPVDVELTRYEDEPLTLTERAKIAKDLSADLVLSIHLNAHDQVSVHGLNLFHLAGDMTAARIADHLARIAPPPVFTGPGRIYATAPLPDWKGRAHNVLSAHRAIHQAPVLLVECCYLTSPRDRAFVLNRWGRAQIVSALRSTVCRFAEMREAA